MKTFIVDKYQKIKAFYLKYERLLMSVTLVSGFLFDFIAFVNIDIFWKFTLLVFYWFLSGVGITFMQLYDAQRIPVRFKYIRLFLPLAIQFMFGGLLNISLIFYWFSGAFSVSWPLMAIMVALLLFNDSFRHYFVKPIVQIPVYFFITFSLASLILPFAFASMSVWLFVAAGVGSVVIFLVGINLLSIWVPNIRQQKYLLTMFVFFIAIIMNVLYFTDTIPPIPLALREAEMYHSIDVTSGQYVMTGEPEDFGQVIREFIYGQTLHLSPFGRSAVGGQADNKAYVYTAIFAPARLRTTIVNNWEYYDAKTEKWVSKNKLTFDIAGGRKEGYKGYSWQSNLVPGKWRVSVENLRGQVLGRVRFTVEAVDTPVKLEQVLR